MPYLVCGNCPASETKRTWFGSKRRKCNVLQEFTFTGEMVPCVATAEQLAEFIAPLVDELWRKHAEMEGR